MCIVRGLEAEGEVALVTLVWHLPGVCLHVLRQQGGVMEHLAAVLTLQARGVNLQYSTVQYSTVQYSTVQSSTVHYRHHNIVTSRHRDIVTLQARVHRIT